HGRRGPRFDGPDHPPAGAGRLGARGPSHAHRGLGAAVVGGQPDRRTIGLWLLSLALPAVAGAQVVPNRTTLYLYPSDVTDARAVWVNPAGSGRFEEASLHLDLMVAQPGAAGRLRQLTLGLSSRGLSFGYQRDVFDAGGRGHTYRIGYAAGRAGLAAGVAAALYRGGGASTSGWDLGVLYQWRPALTQDTEIPAARRRAAAPGQKGRAHV